MHVVNTLYLHWFSSGELNDERLSQSGKMQKFNSSLKIQGTPVCQGVDDSLGKIAYTIQSPFRHLIHI